MLPTTQAALEALVGRALTAPESALAQGRRDADLAASLSAGRSRTAPTLIGYGAVMLALGAIPGAAMLDALEAARGSNRPLHWAMMLLEQGRLDIGDAATQVQVGALVTAGILTQAQADTLVALSRQPDPVPVGTVSDILNSEA